MDTVSVIIPTYNCARYVGAAIESVLGQTKPAVEIIVVDDGSTDPTPDAVAPYSDKIRYFRQKNRGPSAARNYGIREARGQLIAFLDADDEWLPEKLAKQCAYLAAHADVGLVHTDVHHRLESAGNTTHFPRDRKRYSGRCYKDFFWGNLVTTSSVLMRKCCFDEIGAFDEEIVGGVVEDRDMWMRVARRYSLGFIPDPLVIYRVHGESVSQDDKRMAEGLLYVLRKALATDPELATLLGRNAMRTEMRKVAFNAAYASAEAGDLRRARHFARIALRYLPSSITTWTFWASTFLPLSLRNTLRDLKRMEPTRG